MKKYYFPIIMATLLSLPYMISQFGITDMKALTDKELKSVTGQAGIKAFENVFNSTVTTKTASSETDTVVRKKVFDEVFVKQSGTEKTQKETVAFDDAFVNKLGIDFTKRTEQNLNQKIQMEQISFAQAFSKDTSPRIDFDKSYLNENINNPMKSSRSGMNNHF